MNLKLFKQRRIEREEPTFDERPPTSDCRRATADERLPTCDYRRATPTSDHRRATTDEVLRRIGPEATNPLLARALPALLRARQHGEQIAAETNTAVADWIDGKVVLTYPKKPEPSSAE